MHFDDKHPGLRLFLSGLLVCGAALANGCGSTEKPAVTAPRYATLPAKEVPAFLHDTILERCDLVDTEPKLISGFGLVSHLHDTGDNTLIPQTVRGYIIQQMVKAGFGSKLQPGYENMQPEDVLRSKSMAIVRVDGYIPPGARKGDRFDIQVSALPGSNTTNLAHGSLYRTELKVNGAFVQKPGYSVDIAGFGEGSVFANPAYSLQGSAEQSDKAKASLRYGLVLNGGVCMDYRPLLLRLRAPQLSLSRAIQLLIEQRFSSTKEYSTDKIAAAKDEGIIYVQVPEQYHGDWQHFANVVTHLYLEIRPGEIAVKAKRLAEEAQKPDAPLMDISYCWEAIGTPALDSIVPLLASDKPEVAFAAARAGAYIGAEPGAIATLVRMAGTKDHPFQLNAIQVLGDLPSSPVVKAELRKLLDSTQSLVRIEAYKVLADQGDASIYTTSVNDTFTSREKFLLDIVPSKGLPLIYVSGRGRPRIAIIGMKPSIGLPALFSTMEDRLSISSLPDSRIVTIYYRGMDVNKPVRVDSNADIAEVVARLGGIGAPGDPTLNLGYGDVVAILQGLSDSHQICSYVNGQRVAAAFVMQQGPAVQQDILTAPLIPDQGRPEADAQSQRTEGLGLRTESDAFHSVSNP